MIKRKPYETEVDKLESADGKTVFSIRERTDGNYEFYVESINFDNDEEIHYWSQESLSRPSIFGSVVDAKAEIYSQFGHMLISN